MLNSQGYASVSQVLIKNYSFQVAKALLMIFSSVLLVSCGGGDGALF